MTVLVAAARAYLGTPFLHQGRTRLGLDCVGLVLAAAADAGTSFADDRTYPRTPVGNRLRESVAARLGPPVTDGPLVGDIVVLRFVLRAQHVAVVGDHPLGGLSLIHTDSILGRVTEHALDARWRRRIVAVYRIRT